MNLSRRHLLLGAAAAAVPVAACNASGDSPSNAASAITVGLTFIPNIQFSPFYVASAEGLFSDAGLDVTIRHHGTQEGLFTALAAGDEHVVFASSDEAVVAATGDLAGLATFATCYQRYPCVVLANPDITRLPELSGRRLGVPGRYGSNWFATLAALHQAELSQDDVEIVEIGWTQVAALTTGKVDAVVGFSNNEAVQLDASGFSYSKLEIVDTAAPNLVGPGLVTLAGSVEPSLLAALRDAIYEAEQRIVADPEVALRATEAHVPTLADSEQRTQAAAVLEATAAVWRNSAGEVSVAVEEANFTRMAEFLVTAGIIETVPDQTVLNLG